MDEDSGRIRIRISDRVREIMETRHVLEEEVKQVIHNAETKGEKLYQLETDKCLAKMKIEEATTYVEYSITNGGYLVHTVYSHKAEITD